MCPACGGPLDLSTGSSQDSEIIEGQLRLESHGWGTRVVVEVPIPSDEGIGASDKAATAAGFGWQWQHFTQEDSRYAEQFLGWIAPVTPEFFRDKVVLEGGCGKGRHTQLAARWGAPTEVIASGGALLHSPGWTQMMADALGRPITICTETEASCRGAALWALERLGIIDGIDALPASTGAVFTPRPGYQPAYEDLLSKQHQLYERLYGSSN